MAAGNGCLVVFVPVGLLGARLPFALVVGYSLHGLWDLLHELQEHGACSAFEPGRLTDARLQSFLCSLRLLNSGVFLCTTQRVDCRVDYSKGHSWVRPVGQRDVISLTSEPAPDLICPS